VAGHHVVVRPVRLAARDDVLRCQRVTGIGFAWRCSCGARGPIERTFAAARSGGAEHRGLMDRPAAHGD
jgi:hypothetical protein